MPTTAPPARNPYLVLGVTPEMSETAIRREYLARMRVVHPDRLDPKKNMKDWQKANCMAAELNEAYSCLRQEGARARYAEQHRKQAADWQKARAQREPPPAPSPATPPPPQEPVLAEGEYVLQGILIRQTGKAILVRQPSGQETWIPKSQVVECVQDLPYSSFRLSDWFARKLWTNFS